MERSGEILQTTALVHEVYLRLTRGQDVDWHDRVHFFALSAQLMRRILIDAARARTAAKRGGGAARFESQLSSRPWIRFPPLDVERLVALRLDDALESLTRIDPRRAQVVELRFFGGLSVEETAEVLQVSPQTVMRDWRLARAWLARELRSESRGKT